MSMHSANVAAALANHKAYFGEDSTSPNQVEFRETDKHDWAPVENAVVHGEFVMTVRNGMQNSRQTRRHVFCDASQIVNRINSHIRIGGPSGQIYNVTEITIKGDRYQLALTRQSTIETARPGYRDPNRRR